MKGSLSWLTSGSREGTTCGQPLPEADVPGPCHPSTSASRPGGLSPCTFCGPGLLSHLPLAVTSCWWIPINLSWGSFFCEPLFSVFLELPLALTLPPPTKFIHRQLGGDVVLAWVLLACDAGDVTIPLGVSPLSQPSNRATNLCMGMWLNGGTTRELFSLGLGRRGNHGRAMSSSPQTVM